MKSSLTLVDSGIRAKGSASLKEKFILVIDRYKSKDSFQFSKFVLFKVLTEVNGIDKEAGIKITKKHLIHTYCVNKPK